MRNLLFALSLLLAVAAAAPTLALAGDPKIPTFPVEVSKSRYDYDSLRRSMYFVLATILRIAGLAAVVAVVFYGAKMAFAGGDAAKFSEAKKSLLYALLGAVVIFGIYTILATVRGAVDSATRRGGKQEIQVLPN
jgi:hypothetical protein